MNSRVDLMFFKQEYGITSYNKVYTVDIVCTLLYDGGIKGDDSYVDGTSYDCKERMECSL